MPHDRVNDKAVLIETLPAAAQRWLERALPRNAAQPTRVQIEQEGSMEVQGSWRPFTSNGTYKAPPLSFNWKAKFRMMPGLWIVAEDGHLNGQGWGCARLWGLIPMGRRTDPEVLATQLVRNLGELVWLPWFVLVDLSLAWTGAGQAAFEVRSNAGEKQVMVRFEIDEQGDVVRAYSPARPYDVPGGYAEAPWFYEFSEHREFDGVRMPAVAVASFDRDEGPKEYFRGRLTSIKPMQE